MDSIYPRKGKVRREVFDAKMAGIVEDVETLCTSANADPTKAEGAKFAFGHVERAVDKLR